MRRAALGAAILAAFFVAGCGESSQVTVYKQGKYQGKPDSQPWDNAPVAAQLRGSTWTKGERGSWETAINQRTMGQNEDIRIYKQ
ncbi:MAG TPA: hypothetical protein VJ789_07970 [Burkholderiales bacterium]|nr:hypothetical protein [Burkholderiales bacterium]